MSNTTPVITAAHITAIGTAEGRKEDRATAVVLAMPAEFDWTARGAVADAIRTAGGWTKETCPARTKGPKGEQTVTVFGVGFSALESAVTRLVRAPKAPEPGVVRLSLSGEGGETVTLREGDAGYEAALALYGSLVQSDDESAAA